jgi:hypothetical protein
MATRPSTTALTLLGIWRTCAVASLVGQASVAAIEISFRAGDLAALYCFERYYDQFWPRTLLLGGEFISAIALILGVVGVLLRRSIVSVLVTNAVAIGVLAGLSALFITADSLSALCNMDKFIAVPEDALTRYPGWLEEYRFQGVWLGIQPLGGVWVQACIGGCMLFLGVLGVFGRSRRSAERQ